MSFKSSAAMLTTSNVTLTTHSAASGGFASFIGGSSAQVSLQGGSFGSNSATNGNGGLLSFVNVSATVAIVSSTLSGNLATVGSGGVFASTGSCMRASVHEVISALLRACEC